MNTFWSYIKTHLFYLILIGVGLLAFRSWLTEHDNSLRALQVGATTKQQLQDLQDQIVTIQKMADARVQAIQKQVTAVRTPAQAVAVIPQLSNTPLQPQVAESDSTKILVDPIALVKELGQCRQTEVQLRSCSEAAEKKDMEIQAQGAEIKALKKPQGFWKKFGSALKVAGIAFGIGVAAGAHGV